MRCKLQQLDLQPHARYAVPHSSRHIKKCRRSKTTHHSRWPASFADGFAHRAIATAD